MRCFVPHHLLADRIKGFSFTPLTAIGNIVFSASKETGKPSTMPIGSKKPTVRVYIRGRPFRSLGDSHRKKKVNEKKKT